MGHIIVTGVAGFIGSHLAEALLKQNHRVIGIDNFNPYYDPEFKRKNVAALEQYPHFELIEKDILHLNWSTMLQEAEVVYHQAAQAGVRASWGTGFHSYTERNISATQVMLEAAKDATHLKRFVLASTSSIYGDAETLPTSEGLCPKPVSPYGITKLAAEQLSLLYYKNFGVPITVLRYFTVYGPRQRPDMAFHKFFKRLLNEEPIPIYGDGQQTRDFTFIDDAIAANLAAASQPEAIGEIFNIGGGSRVVLNEVIDVMEQVTGHPIKRNYSERAMGDARHTAADISKAQSVLGYTPRISLAEGLDKEWKWIESIY